MDKGRDDRVALAGVAGFGRPAVAELAGGEDRVAAPQLADCVPIGERVRYFDLAARPGSQQLRLLGIGHRELDLEQEDWLVGRAARQARVVDQGPSHDRVSSVPGPGRSRAAGAAYVLRPANVARHAAQIKASFPAPIFGQLSSMRFFGFSSGFHDRFERHRRRPSKTWSFPRYRRATGRPRPWRVLCAQCRPCASSSRPTPWSAQTRRLPKWLPLARLSARRRASSRRRTPSGARLAERRFRLVDRQGRTAPHKDYRRNGPQVAATGGPRGPWRPGHARRS